VTTRVEFAAISNSPPRFPNLPHALHNHPCGRPGQKLNISTQTTVYPPNCSVSFVSSLFKSLSPLRVSSIFSTECSTVV